MPLTNIHKQVIFRGVISWGIACLFFYFTLSTSYAQQGNQIVLGDNWALDFNKSPADTFTTKLRGSGGAAAVWNSSSICGCDGKLLLYTAGSRIWNAEDSVLPNGGEYFCSLGYVQQALGGIIIPMPGSTTKYYVFHFYSTYGNKTQCGYYSVVDMNLNNGKGDVEASNRHVFFYNFGIQDGDRVYFELTLNSNGIDFWLLGYDWTNNKIVVFKISSSGITQVSSIGLSALGVSSISKMKFNNSGTKLIFQTNVSLLSELTFNKNTGALSNFTVKIFSNSNLKNSTFSQIGFSGFQFSNNDSILYVTGFECNVNSSGNDANTFIYQIDYYSGGQLYKNLYKVDSIYYIQPYNSFGNRYLGIFKGPDQKIYGFKVNTIFQIGNPDVYGSGCNFTRDFKIGIYNFPDSVSKRFIPLSASSVYFPVYKLKITSNASIRGNCQMQDSISLLAVGNSALTNHTWYFYNKQNQLIDSAFGVNAKYYYPNEGVYLIKVKAKNPGNNCTSWTWWSDSLYINKAPLTFAHISNKARGCLSQAHTLTFDSLKFTDSLMVNWGDGSSTVWLKAPVNSLMHDYYDSSFNYTITVLSKNSNCTGSTTLQDQVVFQAKPIAKFFSNNSTKTFPIKGCSILGIYLVDSSKNADSVWYVLRNAVGTTYTTTSVNYALADTGWFNIIQYALTKDGCIDSFVVSNAVYGSPKPTVQIKKDSVFNLCTQEFLRLKINTSYNDSTIINWGDGSKNYLKGILNGNSIDTITHYYNTPGVFVVSVMSRNSFCNVQNVLLHMVRPEFKTTKVNDTTLCRGTLMNIWAQGNGADTVFTYILKTPGGTLKNSTGYFLILPDSTTTYIIGTINSCVNDTLWKQIKVTVLPPLSLKLNTIDITLCKGSNFKIIASAAGGNGNYLYKLKKNNILQQINNNGVFNVTITGNEIYNVLLNDNCTLLGDSLQCNIKVCNDLKFIQTPPDVYLCPNENIRLKASTNSGSGVLNYRWYDLQGNTLSTSDTLNFIPTTSQQVVIKVTDACMSIYDTAWIYQFPTTNGTQLNSDKLSGCATLTVNLETPSLNFSNNQPYEALWDFGDGNTFVQGFTNSMSTLKIKHTFINAGIYTVKVKLKFKNGLSECYSFSSTIEALTVPQIKLNITPKKVTLPKTQCTAIVSTMNSDSVVIDWADGFSDNFNANVSLITQTHDYADTGHYIVKAVAYNKNTCYTETKASVYHADTFMCFIPNVFTPNRDASNEVFKPVVSYCKSYELIIYNRWGEEVYRTSYEVGKTQQPYWTGEGDPIDTYLYMLSAVDGDNLHYTFKGTVMLLR